MNRKLDVGIIGCGTAGAASAIFLARQGHNVTVYERVERPSAVGAGVMFQPIGQTVLRRLGLLEEVLERSQPVDVLRCETLERKTLFRLRYDALEGGHQGYGLHRGALFEHLFAAVKKEAVSLKLGVEVVDLATRDDGLDFLAAGKEKIGRHELCVVADGARSQLRDDTTIRKRVRPYPWGALWWIADDDAGGTSRELYQVVDGTQRMVGALPSGLGPGSASEPKKLSVFYSMRHDRVEAWKQRGLAAFKNELLQFMPHLAQPLMSVHDIESFVFTRYHDVSMYPWNTPRVVYLGDAAHAMSPQLGQGANLALWDAMVLSDTLAAHEQLGDGLDAYSRARRSHLGFYEYATRWLTPWFQSDLRPLGWIRDLCMPMVQYLPPLERAMVRAMTGTSRGIGLSSPLTLPALP
jgi:2-polyprenyl-6-methoxyphenol hydroxylase-like FAD-dependent oxidoreductase